MTATRKYALLLCTAIVVCLPGCPLFNRLSTKPTPPRVTDCLEAPSGVYPSEPTTPKTLTDKYVIELKGWGNRVLGIATSDRLLWRGERRCIRKLQDAGQVE